MTRRELRELLDRIATGDLTPEAAQARILQGLRHAPFEDLGFARVDHHRSIRQGFPEVIFGLGKTPEQVGAIAARIVHAGHNLLVTRTTPEAYASVCAVVPGAVFHDTARSISHRVPDPPRGKGLIVIAAAGTADLPVAEEAAVCAEV